jgi:hypothetical protein
MTERSRLDEEIESWKGFPWALRKEDRELWEKMIHEVREGFGNAVEKSGKPMTTEPFFMSLLIAQQRTIKSLLTELEGLGVKMPQFAPGTGSTQAELASYILASAPSTTDLTAHTTT